MKAPAPYKRILIKLSGEALIKEGQSFGMDPKACSSIAQSIQLAYDSNIQIAIVIGGGNLFRGGSLIHEIEMKRTKADQIGMLATCLNGLFLEQTFKKVGCKTKVLSAVPVGNFLELFSVEKTQKYLNEGYLVIFVGGLGHPYFTTDTAASLRALEIEADALLKATKVDGIYSADPKKDPLAKKYDSLTYREVLEKNLQVMDSTAISLCRENKLPIVVFDMYQKENLLNVIQQKKCGTLVYGD